MKKAVTFMIDTTVMDGVRDWIARQPAPPSQSAVAEAALRDFIKRRK